MARDFTAGTTSWLSAGVSTSCDITNTPITVSAWVKPDSLGALGGIVTKYHTSTAAQRQWELFHSAAGLPGFGTYSGTVSEVTGANSLRTNVWQHILGTQDATSLSIWVNGVRVGTSSSTRSMGSTVATVVIGLYYNNVSGFDGQIDDVAVWDQTLSQFDIYRLSQGESPFQISPHRLRGYWPLKDYGTSGQARDYSRYNETLTAGAALPGLFAGPDLPYFGKQHFDLIRPVNWGVFAYNQMAISN